MPFSWLTNASTTGLWRRQTLFNVVRQGCVLVLKGENQTRSPVSTPATPYCFTAFLLALQSPKLAPLSSLTVEGNAPLNRCRRAAIPNALRWVALYTQHKSVMSGKSAGAFVFLVSVHARVYVCQCVCERNREREGGREKTCVRACVVQVRLWGTKVVQLNIADFSSLPHKSLRPLSGGRTVSRV